VDSTAEWAVGFVVEWAGSMVEWVDSVVAVMSAQDFVADSFTQDLGDTAATIQGIDLSSGLATPIGQATVQDGGILTTVIPRTILTRIIRTHTLTLTHIVTPGMLTMHPTKPRARKQMENRFI